MGLPELFDQKTNQPNPHPDITVAAVFRQRYAIMVAQPCLQEAQCEAMAWLHDVANVNQGLACLAD